MFYENLAKEAPNVAARALLHTRREEAQPAAKEQLGVRGGFRATSGRAAARYALRWRGGRVAALGLSAAELFPGPSDFLTYKPETGSGRANRGVLRRLPGNDFASLRLPGRDLIFLLYLRAIMIPFVMLITSHNLDTCNRRNNVTTLALNVLRGRAAASPNLILAGASLAILPPFLTFIFARCFFVESATSSGVKG